MRAAVAKYVEFHQFEPVKIAAFRKGFSIPSRACFVGPAISVAYRSNKLNPETGEDEGTIDYIHEHKKGVNAFRLDSGAEGTDRIVPAWIRNAKWLTRLGLCLEYAYTDHQGEPILGYMKPPLPELYTTPNGQALLIIAAKRHVVAMLWGGRLRVEQRGIVG